MHTKLVVLASSIALTLSGCGTTYVLPDLSEAKLTAAKTQIAKADWQQHEPRSHTETEALAVDVIQRVKPVARDYCEQEHPDWPSKSCRFRIEVDVPGDPQPNAFQTIDDTGRPLLVANWAFLESVANEDELAFALSHEAAHQIGGHLKTKQTQAAVGAAIGGLLAVLAAGAAGAYGPYATADTYQAVGDFAEVSAQLGTAVGGRAYSQTYELEADYIAAYMADAAGYDPERGARWFARMSALTGDAVEETFWSTHPSSPERLAIVAQAAAEIEAAHAAGQEPTLALAE